MIILTATATVAPAAGGRWTVRDGGKRVSPFFATCQEAGAFLTRHAPRTLSAGHVRSAVKPNSARRAAIRYSLIGAPCMTCTLPLDWSRESVGTDGAGELGHVIGAAIGGTYAVGNIGPQCHTCNIDARDAGRADLTDDVDASTVPTRYVPTRIACDRPDPRDVAPTDVPNAQARRVARKRRGLTW